MKRIYELVDINMLEDHESLIRYEGLSAYVRNYGDDGFRFHANPFLSEWYPTQEDCNGAAIDYLFFQSDPLVLLEKYIRLIIEEDGTKWIYKNSGGRLTIIVPGGHVAVVDMNLRVIHATDDDIQCSIYGFIESVKPYKK